MPSYKIHITGIVQGVGFRPFVYRLAKKYKLNGWVCNTLNGVLIHVQGKQSAIENFHNALLQQHPKNASINHYNTTRIQNDFEPGFKIIHSDIPEPNNLLLTPDIGICKDCLLEIHNPGNRRFGYPFTSCTNCGPRASIVTKLPYERKNTSMKTFLMCKDCLEEYNNPQDRRFYAQSISCPNCAINLTLWDNKAKFITTNTHENITIITRKLNEGKIIAIKGVGGFLLLAKATDADVLKKLRKLKNRPAKPFALLYPSLEFLKQDVEISVEELKMLESPASPIVLLKLKNKIQSGICVDEISPGLEHIGVMRNYSALLEIISKKINTPLVATSGNISETFIQYKNNDAVRNLAEVADFILTNSRDILMPQDDSVVQFSEKHQQKIILRRARGLSPALKNKGFKSAKTVLALGATMKGTFSILENNNTHVSAPFGDLNYFENQKTFKQSLQHFTELFKFRPTKILADKHPDFFTHELGKKMAVTFKVPFLAVQHHIAHFAANLAENNGIHSGEKILGVIWDGSGFGDDGNIWGGEFFVYENFQFSRLAHLSYAPNLSGDKMAREPRLSALSFCKNIPEAIPFLQKKFSEAEWQFFNKLAQTEKLFSSSIGRLFDAVASLLNFSDIANHEGEAALYLEVAARKHYREHGLPTEHYCGKNIYAARDILKALIDDLKFGKSIPYIACCFHFSLVKMIEKTALENGINKLAFSGGVFQNSLLTDMIHDVCGKKFDLLFHKELSPNDECISFGQIAFAQIYKQSEAFHNN